MTAKEYKAEDLVALIRKRYSSQNGQFNRAVVLEQVPNGTGMNQGRWIDAAVFEMWPSKGLTRSAFEVKVSRSDFLRELSQPEKHKWCRDSFHELWFVAPKDVIQLAELPKGIGWMYPRGDRLCTSRHAVRNPKPTLDDNLLAGFMRAAYKEIESAHKLTAKDVLDNSNEYKQAKAFKAAVIKLLTERNIPIPYTEENPDNIYNSLTQATMDKQVKQDAERLLQVSGSFQRSIANLTTLFLVIARRALLARNEMGEYVTSVWSVRDEDSVEMLKELSKDSKGHDYQRRYLELIELILNWENCFDGD